MVKVGWSSMFAKLAEATIEPESMFVLFDIDFMKPLIPNKFNLSLVDLISFY